MQPGYPEQEAFGCSGSASFHSEPPCSRQRSPSGVTSLRRSRRSVGSSTRARWSSTTNPSRSKSRRRRPSEFQSWLQSARLVEAAPHRGRRRSQSPGWPPPSNPWTRRSCRFRIWPARLNCLFSNTALSFGSPWPAWRPSACWAGGSPAVGRSKRSAPSWFIHLTPVSSSLSFLSFPRAARS